MILWVDFLKIMFDLKKLLFGIFFQDMTSFLQNKLLHYVYKFKLFFTYLTYIALDSVVGYVVLGIWGMGGDISWWEMIYFTVKI